MGKTTEKFSSFFIAFCCGNKNLIYNFVPHLFETNERMDEIIQIVIFVAAMGLSLLVQQKSKPNKKPATPSPKELLEDMFPEIEEPQETVVVRPVSAPPSTERRKTPFTPHPNLRHKSPPTTPPAPIRQEKKISLSSKEEARRAFIYSEIFNRKY